jgi:hypothetical protein
MMSPVTSSPKDRRNRPRHGLENVQGNLLFSNTCKVLNLSGTGVAVETEVVLRPGRSYAVKIDYEERQIALDGIVAWCRLRGTRKNEEGESVPYYAAGIELQSDLTDKAEEILPMLLERGSLHLERRLAAHVTPEGTDATAPAKVVEVSRSGLRMESPCFPEKGSLLDVRVELGEEALPLTVRVTRTRSLQEREGQVWAEITAEHAALDDAGRKRLDRLIREEGGLGRGSGG